MKTILIAGTLLLAIFLAVYRQRIFLRDPLGKVEREGTALQGAGLFLNYSNDVLIEEEGTERRYLVQHWSRLPGVPQHLACFTGLACWTDADQALIFPLSGRGGRTPAEMSAKEVTFMDETGAAMRARLR